MTLKIYEPIRESFKVPALRGFGALSNSYFTHICFCKIYVYD